MGLQDFLKDAKDILLGNYEVDETESFKQEIENALKAGLIDKATAAELIQTRNSVKKEAIDLEKKQIKMVSLEDGTKVSAKDAKRRKEQLAREKMLKEKQKIEASRSMQNANGPKIDRQRLQREMMKDELEQNKDLNRNYREKN